jgi:SAM-dependent methyltransferase
MGKISSSAKMNMTPPTEEYTSDVLTVLQSLWGEGFLSPGGPAAVNAIVAGLDLRDKTVLDIGCALGGCDEVLARQHGARVIGLDVEAPLIERGRARLAALGLTDRIDLRLYTPGTLPIADGSMDVVFGKDSWTHIEDKRAFFAEVYRVLKPSGLLAASDWLKAPGAYSAEMLYFFKMEELTYHMDTLDAHETLLHETGFVDVRVEDTSHEYQVLGGEEYARLQGPLAAQLQRQLGSERYAHFVEDWRSLTVVLNKGELRTGRLRAKKVNGKW